MILIFILRFVDTILLIEVVLWRIGIILSSDPRQICLLRYPHRYQRPSTEYRRPFPLAYHLYYRYSRRLTRRCRLWKSLMLVDNAAYRSDLVRGDRRRGRPRQEGIGAACWQENH